MAATESNMLALGTIAPDFSLMDTVDDTVKSLQSLKGNKATVILFICNHCPYVLFVNKLLVELATIYKPKEVAFIAISSNNVEKYPQDAPDKMKLHALEHNYNFSYLYDETQYVAKAYDAACTPDIYLFDSDLKLTYRGQLCSARPSNGKIPTGEDLRYAIDCVLLHKKNERKQYPSIGCNIKWK